MKQRFTYIDTEMLEKLSWIDAEKIRCANSLTLIRSHSDFNTLSLLKFLFPLSRGVLNFSTLYYQSGIRMKNKFLKYLKFCIQMGFVRKLPRNELRQYYRITDKGHQYLDMFYIA